MLKNFNNVFLFYPWLPSHPKIWSGYTTFQLCLTFLEQVHNWSKFSLQQELVLRVTGSLPGKFNKRFMAVCYLPRKFIPLHLYPSLSLLYAMLLFTVFQWIIKEKPNTNGSLCRSSQLIYQIITYQFQHEQMPGQSNTMTNQMPDKQSQSLRKFTAKTFKTSSKGHNWCDGENRRSNIAHTLLIRLFQSPK